jgi:hypothetical protein
MVSFSLRQRISYRFLKDPSPVSFHLIQFGGRALKVLHLAPGCLNCHDFRED